MIVTFAAGSTEQTVNVATTDDSDPESPEVFTALLSNANPAATVVITEPMATINITDDEGKVTSL